MTWFDRIFGAKMTEPPKHEEPYDPICIIATVKLSSGEELKRCFYEDNYEDFTITAENRFYRWVNKDLLSFHNIFCPLSAVSWIKTEEIRKSELDMKGIAK